MKMQKSDILKTIICSILFVCFAIFCFWRTKQIADSVYQNTNKFGFSYNWLLPQFSFIQGPNNVIKQSNIILIISAMIFFSSNKTYAANLINMVKISFYYSIIVPFTTTVLAFSQFGIMNISVNFNIILRSFVSFLGLFFFSLFWCLFTLGIFYSIKILTSRMFWGYICSGIFLIIEGFILYSRTSILGKYAPISPDILSKEILILQFPYWASNGWVLKENIGFPYANTSFFYSNMDQFNMMYIILILLIYIIIVNFLPFYMSRTKAIAQSFGFIGIPDDEILNYLSIQTGKSFYKKEHKNYVTIYIGKGICKKRIFINKNKK